MKQISVLLFAILMAVNMQAENLKPYVLGAINNESLQTTKTIVKQNLEKEGFTILGEYQPAKDANRWLIVINNESLVNAVKKQGKLTTFGAAMRVALTLENEKVHISYTNPLYWGNAYFQDKYPEVESVFTTMADQLTNVAKNSGEHKGIYFGSKKGIDVEDLREYQYMFGMPELDDVVELGEFASFQETKDKIDAKLKSGVAGLELVYSVEIPGSKLKLYGLALTGEEGESKFLPVIDINTPKHTAFLPYEILIMDNQVIMLHGRYRIALSFPDLTMGTFSKIMSTPGNVEDAMKKVCE